MISGFDCWANQPALADLGQFILTDLGTHLLDTARACFGEASSLYCQTHRTLAPAVQGENVATIMLTMGKARTSVVVEMAYAKTPHERDSFPQTLAFIEGPLGSLELGSAYRLRVTTARGSRSPGTRRCVTVGRSGLRYRPREHRAMPREPARRAARRRRRRNHGEDNLKTLQLVFGAYYSASRNAVVHFDHD